MNNFFRMSCLQEDLASPQTPPHNQQNPLHHQEDQTPPHGLHHQEDQTPPRGHQQDDKDVSPNNQKVCGIIGSV